MVSALRRAIAALAAAALILPAAALPAAAGSNRDLFNFLAGATTAIIVLKALEGSPVHAAPRPVYPHPYPPPRPAHLYLPGHCAQAYPVPGAHDVVYLSGCLRSAGYHWALPVHCECQVMTDRGWRRAYSGNCLHRSGYIVATGWHR